MNTPASSIPPLRLPAVVHDSGLPFLFDALGTYANRTPAGEPLVLDMQRAEFYMPGAIAVLLATIHHWLRRHREVRLLYAEIAPAFRYWQRIDFFAQCGLALPESFTRRSSSGRFVSIKRITASATNHVDAIARELAACLFPEQAELDDPEQTGPFDLVVYAATELINNVLQHAHSDAFVLAQVYPKQKVVRLAIADFGIGIRGSFDETRPDFWDASLNDLDAKQLALKPKISSKPLVSTGWATSAVNAGVGISVIKELARDADGVFTLASHAGFHQSNHFEDYAHPSEQLLAAPFPGTLCALQVSKDKLVGEQLMLRRAKERLRLLDNTSPFDTLFEQ